MFLHNSNQGDENYDMTTRYFLHKHKTDKSCDDSCQKDELLETNFEAIPLLPSKFIPIFISSLHQKMQGIVNNLIKNQNCNIFGNEYYVGVNFTSEGDAVLEGLIWTTYCDQFNEKLSAASLSGEIVDNTDYLSHISKSILTTSDEEDLKSILDLSEDESISLSKQVRKYQLESSHQPMENLKLPSLDYYLTLKPNIKHNMNIEASEILVSIFQKILHETTLDDKCHKSTTQWLNDIEIYFDINVEDTRIEINHENETIYLQKDKRLLKLIEEYQEFQAIYHYAITCSRIENVVVLKRKQLIESYTTPYNAQLLKAFKQRIEICPIHSYIQWDMFHQKYQDTFPELENTEVSKLLASHQLINIIELVSLCDSNKIRDLQSSRVEFVSTNINMNPRFKKTTIKDDKTFINENDQDLFEKLSSNRIRHETRLNGTQLLLVETALWYDSLSKAESKEVYQFFNGNLKKIPKSEIPSIYGEENMPKYILCQDENVLKIRSKKKVLETPIYPKDSLEYKISMTLLYYPLSANTSIDKDRIDEYYFAPNQNEEMDSNGRLLTTIQSNQRKIMTRNIWDPDVI